MRRPSALASLAWLVAVATAALAPPARGDDLPRAETVLEDYVKATGGKAAYEKLKNRTAKGTIEIAGAGIKGTVKFIQAAPNRMLMAMDLGQLQFTQATDGKTAWLVSPALGDRLIEGDEKEQFLQDAEFNDEIHWRDRYTKMECTGVEDVNGKPAYKLVLTPKVGKPLTKYYDKETHLQVKEVKTIIGPNGEMTSEQYESDYRKADGILVPFALTQKQEGQTIEFKLTEMKHNVDLPADTFKVPVALEPALEK